MPVESQKIPIRTDEPSVWVKEYADGTAVDLEITTDRPARLRHCMITRPAASAVSVKHVVVGEGSPAPEVAVEVHAQTTDALAADNSSCGDGRILRGGKDKLAIVMPSTGAKKIALVFEFYRGE